MPTRNLNVRVDSDTRSFERGFAAAATASRDLSRELDRTSDKIDALDREIARGEALMRRGLEEQAQNSALAIETMGRSLVAVGAAGALGLGLAAKAAIDWETAWAGVTKTVEGTPEQMGLVEDSLRDLARTLPATHAEIAAVAEAAGALGVRRQDIASFTRTMIDLGETTNLTADEAATALAQLANVMGTSTADVDRLGSTLVALGNAGASTERDILAMAQRLAGVGNLVGASESDVLGMASAMSSLGIEAELGGGAMSRTMTEMMSAVRSGGAALDRFARVAGVSAAEFARQFETDPIRAVDAFVKGLDRVNSTGGDVSQVLASVGLSGTQNAQVLLRMAGAGELLGDSLDVASDAFIENIALLEEANKRYETTASRIETARNQIVDAGIDIGGVLLPAVADMVSVLGDLVAGFAALPGPVKTALTVFAAMATAVSLTGGAFLLAVPRIAAYRAAISGMGRPAQSFAGALKVVSGALIGPWGAALGAGIIALTVFAAKKGEASRRSEEFRATLDAETGAVTRNSAAQVYANLQKSGALRLAKELGLSAGLVVQATLGEEAALRQVTAAVNDAVLARTDLVGVSSADVQAAKARATTARELRDILLEEKGAVDAAVVAQQAQIKALAGVKDASDGAAGAADGLKGQTDGVGGAMDGAATDAQKFREQLDLLNGASRTAQQTLIREKEALAALHVEVGEGSRTLSVNSEEGRKNRQAFIDAASAVEDHAQAVFDNTGEQGKSNKVLENGRVALLKQAMQLGLTREEAHKFVDQLLQIPPEIPVEIKTPGMAQAKADVDSLAWKLENLPRKRYIDIVTRAGFASGTVDYFGGGTGRKAAGGLITGPGGPREDRAGVFALSNREYVQPARATDYYGVGFMEAIRTLRLPRMAAGGLVGGTTGQPMLVSGPTVHVHVQDASGLTERAIARAAARGMSEALSLRTG